MSNEYYNKWDRFYQDESSDEEKLEPVHGDKGAQIQNFRLINVPWDSTGGA